MTYSELKVQLSQAEKHITAGRYQEADRLAQEVIDTLGVMKNENSSGSNEVEQQKNELRCTALLTMSDTARLRGEVPLSLSLAEKALSIADESNIPALKVRARGNLGNVHWSVSEHAKALEYYSEALGLAEELGDKVAIARYLSNIGLVFWGLSEYAKALEYFGKALSLAEELGNKVGMAKTLGNIGVVYIELHEYEKALEFLDQALRIAEELGDRAGVASHLGNIGTVHVNLSEYVKALEYYGKALRIAEELGNKANVVISLNNIGNVHLYISDYAKALEYYGKALHIAEELGNKERVADSLGNIGIVYTRLADYTTALDYLGKGLRIAEELGNRAGVTSLLGNIGNVYLSLSDNTKALEYYGKALSLAEELGKTTSIAVQLGNIGDVHQKQGDYQRAHEYYLKALHFSEEINANYPRLHWLYALGRLYFEQRHLIDDPTVAEKYLLTAIADSTTLGVKQIARDATDTCFRLYKEQERWKEALAMKERSESLKDEINIEEVQKQESLRQQQKEIELARATAAAELKATTGLLHRVLPASIATRIIQGEEEIADYFPTVSILFADIAGFTPIASQMQARDVMSLLNFVFAEFDRIMEKHGCQKIKTMGDGYMAVCGAPIPCDDHAERLANAALDLLDDIELPESLRSSLPKGSVFHLRIGLHCGPAFAGIVGEKGFVYDVYSDAVNLASRMESHGEPGRIQCSEDFAKHLRTRSSEYRFIDRGELDIKGKGRMQTYFLEAK